MGTSRDGVVVTSGVNTCWEKGIWRGRENMEGVLV